MKITDIFLVNSSSKVSVWAGKKTSPTLICLPAMGVRASYYEPFAEALYAHRFNVITADWRGLGNSSLRASRKVDFGYNELIQDVGSVLGFAETRFPKTDKILVGHSLGGQIGSLYAAQNPGRVSALILIASCSVYHKGWEGLPKIRVVLAGNLFYPISQLLGYFPGKQIGFGGQEARTVIRDWSYTIRTGIYKPQDTDYDFETALSKLIIPKLAISFKGDQLAPKMAVNNLLDKFNSFIPAAHHHLSTKDTGTKSLNHFSWAKEPNYLVELIEKWWTEQQDS